MKKISLYTFLILFIFSFFEISARYYIKITNSKNTGMNLKGKTYGILQSDNVLGYVNTGNAYNTSRVSNNMGFLNINNIVLPEKRNAEDVVFIAYGGSTTFCYNLEQNEAWPIILQKKLCESKKNNQLCKFSVFNGGHIMWSIGHVYEKLKRDLPVIKPNYLIIYSGINDYANYENLKLLDKIDVDKSIKNKEYGLIKKYNWWFVRLNLVSAKLINYKLYKPLVNFIKGLTEKPNNKKIQNEKYYDLAKDNFPIVFENYLGVLEKLINLADKHNTKVIFLVQSQGTDTKKNIFITSFSQKAKKKANELGAIIIDTREMVDEYKGDKQKLFSKTGVHYSVKGSNLVGKFLLTKLKEKKILDIK
tara:strand:- start:363 stop:1448 length:1086 start_codon:yes stop_codon:yes gene_type:complete